MTAVTTPVVDSGDPESVDSEALVERLTQEVEHLRSCVAQILDLLDDQSDAMDDLGLLADRIALVERRVQRAESAGR